MVKKVFVGVLDGNSDLVHGNKVKEGNGRFLIKSVLLRIAPSWKNYNPDIHCVGNLGFSEHNQIKSYLYLKLAVQQIQEVQKKKGVVKEAETQKNQKTIRKKN